MNEPLVCFFMLLKLWTSSSSSSFLIISLQIVQSDSDINQQNTSREMIVAEKLSQPHGPIDTADLFQPSLNATHMFHLSRKEVMRLAFQLQSQSKALPWLMTVAAV